MATASGPALTATTAVVEVVEVDAAGADALFDVEVDDEEEDD